MQIYSCIFLQGISRR